MPTDTPPPNQPPINLAIATDGSTITDSTITTGDITGRDKITTGDISHNTGVAIGDHATSIVNLIHQSPPPRIPLQRPPRAEHFVDRTTELAQLLDDLQPGQVATLCGPGGIGKTALAAKAVWTLAPNDDPPARFPDGILFHSFYNQPQAAIALEHIARTFGEEPKPTPKEAAQRALAGRKALLILDGAEQADDLRQLINIRDQCALLITSRQRKDAPSIRQDLIPLPLEDALTLLRAWAGKRAHTDTALRRISEWVGRLPLALRLVGRYLDQSEEDASDYVTWLAQTPLAALDHGQRQHESVPLLLERSLAQLSQPVRQVMGVIGILALAPFSRATITAALDWPEQATRQALATLVDYGLLQRPQEIYEVSHALIHTYARQKLLSSPEVIVRTGVHFEKEVTTSRSDFSRMKTIQPHVMALLRLASERAIWDVVRSLTRSIDTYLDLQGYWVDRIETTELDLKAVKAMENRQVEGVLLGRLGSVYADLGQFERAIDYHQQALTIAIDVGDLSGASAHLGNLGGAYYALAQYEQAYFYFQRTLAIAREIGNRRNEGAALNNLGNVYFRLRHIGHAIGCYKQSLLISKELGNKRSEAEDLGNLGAVCRNTGQFEQAIAYHLQSLAIIQEIGDRKGEGTTLSNLAR